jgi:hypothetical protein
MNTSYPPSPYSPEGEEVQQGGAYVPTALHYQMHACLDSRVCVSLIEIPRMHGSARLTYSTLVYLPNIPLFRLNQLSKPSSACKDSPLGKDRPGVETREIRSPLGLQKRPPVSSSSWPKAS